jgi:hypothetical protein
MTEPTKIAAEMPVAPTEDSSPVVASKVAEELLQTNGGTGDLSAAPASDPQPDLVDLSEASMESDAESEPSSPSPPAPVEESSPRLDEKKTEPEPEPEPEVPADREPVKAVMAAPEEPAATDTETAIDPDSSPTYAPVEIDAAVQEIPTLEVEPAAVEAPAALVASEPTEDIPVEPEVVASTSAAPEEVEPPPSTRDAVATPPVEGAAPPATVEAPAVEEKPIVEAPNAVVEEPKIEEEPKFKEEPKMVVVAQKIEEEDNKKVEEEPPRPVPASQEKAEEPVAETSTSAPEAPALAVKEAFKVAVNTTDAATEEAKPYSPAGIARPPTRRIAPFIGEMKKIFSSTGGTTTCFKAWKCVQPHTK